jgi:hypothetical protein
MVPPLYRKSPITTFDQQYPDRLLDRSIAFWLRF